MQLVYHSDHYVVVQFDVPGGAEPAPEGEPGGRGGYEIVDKFARREIFIEGALADRFRQGVTALVEQASDGEAASDAVDAYLAGYVELASQRMLLH